MGLVGAIARVVAGAASVAFSCALSCRLLLAVCKFPDQGLTTNYE